MSDTSSPGHDAETMAKVAGISEEHKRFEPFAGVFQTEVKLWMGPGDPQVSTGVMTNTLDLGGRFLAQSYKGDPMQGPFPAFEGRGFWGFNATTGKYEGFWIDNASTCFQIETGDVDETGRVWTMVGEMIDPSTGKPIQKRSVITLQDQDHHHMEMYFASPEGGEYRTMEIRYQRKR